MEKFCVKGEKTWPLFRQLYLSANILFNSNTEYRKQNTNKNKNTKKTIIYTKYKNKYKYKHKYKKRYKFCVKGEKTQPLFWQLYLSANILFKGSPFEASAPTKGCRKISKILIYDSFYIGSNWSQICQSSHSVQEFWNLNIVKLHC